MIKPVKKSIQFVVDCLSRPAKDYYAVPFPPGLPGGAIMHYYPLLKYEIVATAFLCNVHRVKKLKVVLVKLVEIQVQYRNVD